MKEALVSIIVPVYNGEQHIKRCIKSILSQSYSDIELIVVDDGSRDNSPWILDTMAAEDGRIRVFHIENGGVSRARNFGLDKASGEFVMFVDCDDYIDEDTVRRLYLLFADDVDMTQCTYKIVDDSGNSSSFYSIKDGTYEGRESILTAFFDIQILQSCWAKLYRSSLLEGLRFDSRYAVGEDDYFSFCVCKRAKKIKTVNEPYYCYYENQGSVMRAALAEKHFQIFDILDIQLSECKGEQKLYTRCAVKDVQISNMHIYRIFSDGAMYDKFEKLKNRISMHKKIIFSSKEFSVREKLVFALLIYAPRLYFRLKKGSGQ